jgi:hypothetical protein
MRLLTIAFLLLTASLLSAQTASAEYIGGKKCKMCHNKAEKGAQYTKWEASGHARAFDALLTDEAKAIAKKMGLKTTPDQAGECLKCHVTGWGTASGYQLTVDEADRKVVSQNEALKAVTCESCHGAGSLYKGKKDMEAIHAGTVDGATLGLVKPDEKICLTCHNDQSPTFKPFVFKERAAKIAHMYP